MTRPYARVAGEALDADQIGWTCDDCDRDEYSCECVDEPRCQHCDEILNERDDAQRLICACCDEPLTRAAA